MNNNYPYNDYQNNYQNSYNNSSDEQYQEEGVSIFFTLAIVLLLLLFAMYFFKFGIFKEKEEMVSAEAISLNMKEAKIAVGQSLAIEATITPKDSTDFVVWSSSDTSIATVDNNGKVLGLKPGSVKITAKINERILAECVVVIVDSSGEYGDKYNAVEVYPSSISISESSKEISVGENYKIEVQLLPANVTNDALTWSSSNPSVATVYNGEVVGVSPGTVVISVKTVNDLVEAVTITVKGVPVEGLKIDKSSESITVNGSVTLVAETVPEDATNPGITWSSSDESIAVVDNTGKVTGKKVGSVTITATSANKKTATCKVSVVSKEVPITSISLKKTNISLSVNESYTLKATISPSSATNKAITWSSSDRSVATVSSGGKVTGKKVGSATITATTSNGLTATAEVNVSNTAVTGITLNKSSMSLTVGSTGTFTATVSPVNASDKSVSWSSSDRSVATVDSSGKVTAKKAGTTTITATASNGMTAKATVTVNASGGAGGSTDTTIRLNKSSETICVGCTTTLVATTNPSGLSVTWRSNDSSVATVTSGGIVKGIKVGSTTIVASAGGQEARFVVTVKSDEIQSVSLDKTSATVEVNKTVRLTPTIYPTTVTNKSVTWKSSNTSVATVVNGIVTGIKAGSATITVTTSNGKTATCAITVVNPGVTSITLNKTTLTLAAGSSSTLTATVVPSNASTTITWSSSNESVAKVSNGKVTAIKAGTTTIRATASNGVYATCSVTVSGVAITGISVSPSSTTLSVGGSRTLSVSPVPSNATLGTVTWSSSNTNVASVSSSGKVIANRTGTARITATYGNFTDYCDVTVTSSGGGSVYLTITPSYLYGGIYENATFSVTVYNASSYNIAWYSSGPCSLYSSGRSATAYSNGYGDCTITARDTYSGASATATYSIGYG